MIKKNTAEKKIKRLEEEIYKLELGLYCPHSSFYIADQISWIHRYCPEYRARANELAEKMINYFNQKGCL